MFVMCMTTRKTTLSSTSEWDACGVLPTDRHPSMYVTVVYRHALQDTNGVKSTPGDPVLVTKPIFSETTTLYISTEHLLLTSRLPNKTHAWVDGRFLVSSVQESPLYGRCQFLRTDSATFMWLRTLSCYRMEKEQAWRGSNHSTDYRHYKDLCVREVQLFNGKCIGLRIERCGLKTRAGLFKSRITWLIQD